MKYCKNKCSLGEHNGLISKTFKKNYQLQSSSVYNIFYNIFRIHRFSTSKNMKRTRSSSCYLYNVLFSPAEFLYRSLEHDYEIKQRIYVKSINRKLTQDILLQPLDGQKRYTEFDFMYTFHFLAIVLFGFTSTFLLTNCEGELPKCAPVKHVLYE